MKKSFSAALVSVTLLFSMTAFSKEMAKASADTLVQTFRQSAGSLSIADMNSLLAAEICVYENFLDFTREFERIVLATPDLNPNDISQVSTLIKLRVTSEAHVKTIKTMLPSDYDRVISAIATLRAQAKAPQAASTLGLAIGDVKPVKIDEGYAACTSDDFLIIATPSLDAVTFTTPVAYEKPTVGSSSDLTVKTGEDGKISFDTSAFGIVFTPAKTTLGALLLKGTTPR